MWDHLLDDLHLFIQWQSMVIGQVGEPGRHAPRLVVWVTERDHVHVQILLHSMEALVVLGLTTRWNIARTNLVRDLMRFRTSNLHLQINIEGFNLFLLQREVSTVFVSHSGGFWGVLHQAIFDHFFKIILNFS